MKIIEMIADESYIDSIKNIELAKPGFLLQGIKSRAWLEKEKAHQSVVSYIIIWTISLAILLFDIYFHTSSIQ